MSFEVILAFASAICGVAIGLTVAWQERRSVAHWAFVAGMMAISLESLFTGLAADAVSRSDFLAWQGWRLKAMAFLPGCWLFFSLTYARGNYREFLSKRRAAIVFAFLVPIAVAIVGKEWLFQPLDLEAGRNPSLVRLGAAGMGLQLFFLVSAILVLMNLERTFRAAVGTMRWRIKFMVVGIGVLFAVRAYSSSQVLLYHAMSPALQAVNSGALLVACLLILRSLFRVGHFEVSVYPSQSVLQNSITVLLAGIYLVIVGVLAKIVAFLGGDASFTLKAFLVLVCLVMLTVVLLSDRVRLKTKRFVSRHFQRPLYDYRSVWRTFTEGTARRVERTDLCGAVAKLVSEIFQALSVTIWLVDDRKESFCFAASTSLTESKAGHLLLESDLASQVIAAIRQNRDPFDLDACKEVWAAGLRRLHPEEFPKGGNRVCVPMFAGGESIGVMIAGDRVGAIPFSDQDLDLLKSVGDQAAASLLNIEMQQRLAQGRQLEAFQAMSAFFVHDLKNTASTLSLMLQNLPLHFNDPAFREDALRGVSKTVSHINDLIGRLSLLRQELAIKPIEADLNETVSEALRSMEAVQRLPGEAPGYSTPACAQTASLVTDLRPLSRIRLDPAQIRNVVTNLVLNARDAAGSDGEIKIETSQHNGWAVLSVADNGCGMTHEFVQNSLFRPFQTTKKKGIGIGMFQCKMIVEGHQGRIEVESEPGKGTTFRVLLPQEKL
jgi:putative PEP-CTERM system histidine kinase